MKKKYVFGITIFMLMFLFDLADAWNYLRVQDPRVWGSEQGTIESASIEVLPLGISMQYSLTLTFSARNTQYGAGDTLEVVLDFDLPKNAIIHDMWLWIEGVPVQAKIMDRWTASDIYENIVRRRRDPAVLFKNNDRDYTLSIFPMAGNETRKVKICYLTPSQWLGKTVAAVLPTNILTVSKNPLLNFEIINPRSATWNKPSILEFPDIPFTLQSDTTYGEYYYSDIVFSDQMPIETGEIQPFRISFNNPRKGGVYCSRFDYGGNGVYQFAFIPAEVFDLDQPVKVTFLIDYDPTKTTVYPDEIVSALKSVLNNRFTRNDSFNLVFTGLSNLFAGDHWFAGDSAGIADAFSAVGENPVASFSNIPGLLQDGITFIRTHGDSGQIILFADNDQLGDYRIANPLIEDIIDSMDNPIPIHIGDYQNTNIKWYYFRERYYVGNEYFYINLSKLTGSNYLKMEGNLSQLFSQTLAGLAGKVSSFDIYTSLDNGFTYGRYNPGLDEERLYTRNPILQVGRYWGDGAIEVQLSGVYSGMPFSRQITIPGEDIFVADSLNEELWTGTYISDLEAKMHYDYWFWSGGDNEDIDEIIEQSLNERVLSIYTSFIALEPGDSSWVNSDPGEDGGGWNDIEDEDLTVKEFALRAYPNPFNISTTIELKIPSAAHLDGFSLIVYNIKGQKIREFDPALINPVNSKINMRWDGKNDHGEVVSTGVYFVVFKAAKKILTLKLILIK